MISQTAHMEFAITHTETEALLLEANLIKKLKPRYNILLRDDKSFPYLMFSAHAFPRILKHRGAIDKKAEMFGPFASVGALNSTLALLQRVFLLRPCPDTVFKNRSRPCLQYQIKRCTGPCVGHIEPQAYADDVADAEAFLRGDTQQVLAELEGRMMQHAEKLEFEQAAELLRLVGAVGVHLPDHVVAALERDGEAVQVRRAQTLLGRAVHDGDGRVGRGQLVGQASRAVR